MGIKVANNAFGTLAAGINSSATSITLTTGQGARFPTLGAGDYFYATLIDTSNNLEIVKCTARSTDVLTVVRAQENTTARAYSTGDRIEIRITAQTFEDATGIEDGEVTEAKIASGAVTAAKLSSTAVTDKLGFTPLSNAAERFPQDRFAVGADYKNKQTRVWKGTKSNGTITLINLTIGEIPVSANIYMTVFAGAHGATRAYIGSAIYAAAWFGQTQGGNRGTGADASISWSVSGGTLTVTLSSSGFPASHDYTVVFDGIVGVGPNFTGNDVWVG